MKTAFWHTALMLTMAVGISAPVHSQDKVRLRYGTTMSFHNLPVWVAKSAGLFDRNGLDIEVILVRGGALNIMGIVADRLQLSSVGPEAVVGARLQGSDVVILACAADTEPVYVITRPEMKNTADLKGKSSAVTRLGGTTHLYLRVGLKRFGLDADKDLTILQMGRSSDVAAALERGQIAVAAVSYVYAQPLLEKGWPVLVELSKAGFKYPPACVASTRVYVKRNPAVIDAFLRSYIEAIQRIKADPRIGEDVYMQFTREGNRELVRKAVRVYGDTFNRIPYASDQGIETVISGLSVRQISAKELLLPDNFRDNGPLLKIDKSGFVERLYKQ
jgi:ABC-type nitrate/sulfonate/bicarbonate transport system substrate-binding protein